MTWLLTLPVKAKAWRPVPHAFAQNRTPSGALQVVTGQAFRFSSRSYRAAEIRFDVPIDRVVIECVNSAYPTAVSMSGIATASDLRTMPGLIRIKLSVRRTGTIYLGAAGVGSGWFEFSAIYGEVYQ